MSTNTTTTYFVTVRDDGTIVVPEELAAGTMVAVTVLPTVSEAQKARQERFAATLKLIDEANKSDFEPPKISDEELKALIKEARNSKETLRWASVITAYQAQEINLGKAAELLGMHELELKAQFIELGIPLRLGPADLADAEKVRQERFAATSKAIDEANKSGFEPPKISDEELKALIKEARNSKA